MAKRQTFSALIALSLSAALAAGAATLTYTGANGGDWDTASNWDGGAVPTIGDDVVINAKWVKSAGSVSAKSITVTGTAATLNAGLVVGGKTTTQDGIQAQTPADAATTTPVVLTVAEDLVLNKAGLSLGGRAAVGHVAATVGGDFSLSNGARAAFYAGRTDGLDYTQVAAMQAAVYADADIVAVGGTMRVGTGCYVYPENNGDSGTPVIFKPVDFVLESGATLSATGRGFGWFAIASASALPAGAHRDTNGQLFGTYCPGAGSTYGKGAGYGANGRSAGVANDANGNSVRFGLAYGFAFAPLLPGAPQGTHNASAASSRGGGTVCVIASGSAKIYGKIVSQCNNATMYGSGCGGAIWIVGGNLFVAPSASFDTEGGQTGYAAQGSGGRISLAAGLSDADIATLAGGTLPATISAFDLYGCDFNVLGGYYTGGRANSGTATVVYSAATALSVAVAATSGRFSTPTPAYGLHLLPKADIPAFTIAETTTYPAFYRGLRRYAHSGYLATDSDGDAIADVVASAKPVTVEWQWSGVEDCVRLRVAGGGTMTVNGTGYAADADLWLAPGTPLAVSAASGSGAFAAFYGDFDGGRTNAASLSLAARPGLTLWAVFSDATGTARSYVGADNGFWDVDSNWSPAGVPSPLDDATIASKQVKAYGVAVANSLTLSAGKLAVGGASAAATTAQTAPSDGYIHSSGIVLRGDLSATGASAVSLGARRPTAMVAAAEIGGTLSLAGTSTFSAYANPYDGELDPNGKIALTSYYGAATAVTVGGDLTLSDSAVVYPENDIRTGTAVRFDVAGDVEIGASAAFDANNRGWGWTKTSDNGGVADPHNRKTDGDYFTLAPGSGASYTGISAYGGTGSAAVNGRSSASAYGFKYAPYLPGSPCGAYSSTTVSWRPGGTVWIKTAGTLTVNGAVRAKCTQGSSTGGRPSGGGIWLVCGDFESGSGAILDASSTENASGGPQAPGSGGRISIAIGVSDADLDALGAGEEPSSLSLSDEITIISAAANGGTWKNGSTTYPGVAGTLTTVLGAVSTYPLAVVSVPYGLTAPGLDYATVNVTVGQPYSVTAPAYAFDPAYPGTVRYSCAGWVVSNVSEQVAAGNGTTASFVPETGPFTLTWLWTNRETAATAIANDGELGAVAVGGGEATASSTVWMADSGTVTLSAMAAEGAEFLYWVGDVPYGKEKDNPVSFDAAEPRSLTALFRVAEAPTTRTWIGGARTLGRWEDPAKWSPANIPGFNDDVIVEGSGWVMATSRVEVASLTVRDNAIVLVADKVASASSYGGGVASGAFIAPVTKTRLGEAAVLVAGDIVLTNDGQLAVGFQNVSYHTRVSAGGDFRLSNTARFLVAAGPTDETFTFARGACPVAVGGTFLVGDTARVYPKSDPYTGGSVVFRSKKFVLEAGATIDAISAGFYRFIDRDPYSLAPGLGRDHSVGGGYGGYGYNYSASAGRAYGFAYAPVHPGSPGGDYSTVTGGGGLVRIHADEMAIAGTVNASATSGDSDVSSSSGGGIWLTSRSRPVFAAGALLKARGGYRCTAAGAEGGGGRIAIGIGLTAAQVDELAATGTLARRPVERRLATDAFLADNPEVTVNVRDGKGVDTGIYAGTFHVLDFIPKSTLMRVR